MRLLVSAAPRACSARVRGLVCSDALGLQLAALEESEELQISLTDTLADLAVYSLLFGVVALTIYSLVVTLDESNKAQGGWTKPDETIKKEPTPTQTPMRLRKGARYDPSTDEWTYPTEEELSAESKASKAAESESNRFKRRADKKLKKKRKSAKK